MRRIIPALQLLVGGLFIISGIVKANDPLGLSYKMKEFFELWSAEWGGASFFNFLHSNSLSLSIFIITLEIITGLALILLWKRNFILGLLWWLTAFFTFLTGYAYLSGKFTNCGCFGDCLPITPLASFGKDIVLLLLISLLIWRKKYLKAFLPGTKRIVALGLGLAATLALQAYVLNYMPIADCLPFHKGSSLPAAMKPPPGAVTDSFAIVFVYEKEGKQYEFTLDQLPADFNTYKLIERKDKLIRKGNAEPAIKGFSLNGRGGVDSTEAILSSQSLLMIFFQSPLHTEDAEKIRNVSSSLSSMLPVILVSPSLEESFRLAQGIKNASPFTTDFTVVRTAARTNPTYYLLERGVVKEKWSEEEEDAIKSYFNKK